MKEKLKDTTNNLINAAVLKEFYNFVPKDILSRIDFKELVIDCEDAYSLIPIREMYLTSRHMHLKFVSYHKSSAKLSCASEAFMIQFIEYLKEDKVNYERERAGVGKHECFEESIVKSYSIFSPHHLALMYGKDKEWHDVGDFLNEKDDFANFDCKRNGTYFNPASWSPERIDEYALLLGRFLSSSTNYVVVERYTDDELADMIK